MQIKLYSKIGSKATISKGSFQNIPKIKNKNLYSKFKLKVRTSAPHESSNRTKLVRR